MRACAFCLSENATLTGEHLWDDWLNRENGKPVRQPLTFTETGRGGKLVRSWPDKSLTAKRRVVCEACNNGWMSELTSASKATAEGMIRYERHVSLLPLGIATLSTFLFMKAVVVDCSVTTKPPFFSPSTRNTFYRSPRLSPPNGVQIWVGWFRGVRRFAGHTWASFITVNNGNFKGFKFLVFTYTVGHLVLHLTFPRYMKSKRWREPLPQLTQNVAWNDAGAALWPSVGNPVNWPTAKYLSDETLKPFHNRWATGGLTGPTSRSR